MFINDTLSVSEKVDSMVMYDGSLKVFILLSNSLSDSNVDTLIEKFKNYELNTASGDKMYVEDVRLMNIGQYLNTTLICIILILVIFLGIYLFKKYYK